MVSCLLTSTVSFCGTETAYGTEYEIYYASHVLWNGSESPPMVLPFRFVLPNELLQCMHFPRSSLDYRLEAKLITSNGTLTTVAPVHLMRYMRPEWEALAGETSATYSLNPVFWAFTSPIQIYMRLERTILRLTEPIAVQFHIPPPQGSLIMERKVEVHSVEASLVRLVAVKQLGFHVPDSAFEQAAFPDTNSADIQTVVMAHTGKLCRLHSQRPLHLCLVLHPSTVYVEAGSSCQSAPTPVWNTSVLCSGITQRTALHDVRFAVRLRAVMYSNGKRQDVCAARLVKILPAPAGPVVDDADIGEQYRTAQALDAQQGATKAKIPNEEEQMAAIFNEQAEYDGYDDASAQGPSSLLLPGQMDPPPSHQESAHDVRVDELAPPRPEDELVAAMRIALAPQVSEALLESNPLAFETPTEDNVLPSYADAASTFDERSSFARTMLLDTETGPPSYAQSAQRQYRTTGQSTDANVGFPPLYEV